jgi:hypothetical protein
MVHRTYLILSVATAAALTLSACSSSSKPAESPTPTTRPPAAQGPAAAFSGPLTGGHQMVLTESVSPDLAKYGYTTTEYSAAGQASSYSAVGTLAKDGHWQVAPDKTAAYRTRIVVRLPKPQRFNGTLLVEWLNVTAGSDTDPNFMYAGAEIVRKGYAWVGVSAQKVGVSGGDAVLPIAATGAGGLVGADPARYGALHHPGDQYAFDIFTQITRALRAPSTVDPLHGLRPKRVLALGESQSAFQLTTYINAFQPTTQMFDGFFVYSRGGGATPLNGGAIDKSLTGGIQIRDDTQVPVLMFETETDEAQLRYFEARQPDSDHIRLWDITGAAHADAFIVGDDPTVLTNVLGCKGSVNTAPTHFLVAAALDHLNTWASTGTAPPSAPRMEVKMVNGAPVVQRDTQGIAIGGIRTGANDVPVAALSGEAPAGTKPLCALFGTTKAFDHATLVRLYKTKAAYVKKFTAATDKAIAQRYLLQADRAAILALAAKVKF